MGMFRGGHHIELATSEMMECIRSDSFSPLCYRVSLVGPICPQFRQEVLATVQNFENFEIVGNCLDYPL